MAEEIMRRWKLDNDTIRRVCRLVRYHDHANEACTMSLARRAVSVLEDDVELFLEVKRADVLAQSTYMRDEKLKLIDDYRAAYEEIINNKQCCKELGVSPGPDMGRILKELLETVIEDPEKNDRDELLKLAKQMIG